MSTARENRKRARRNARSIHTRTLKDVQQERLYVRALERGIAFENRPPRDISVFIAAVAKTLTTNEVNDELGKDPQENGGSLPGQTAGE